jgi:hypothetical protein
MVFIVTLILVVFSFIAYLLFHERTFAFVDAHTFTEYLSKKTDIDISEPFVFMTLFAGLSDHTNDWHKTVSPQ